MKLSLMKKLMFGFGVVSLFLLAVGLVGVWSVNSTTEAYKPIADVALPRTMAVGDMRANALDVIRLLNQLNFMGAAPEEVDRVDKKVTSAIEMYQKSEQEYLKYMSPAGKPYYDKVKAAMDLVLADIEKYRPLAKSSSLGDKIDFAKAYEGDFKNHRQALYAAFDELLKIQKEVVDKSILEASDKANHMRWLTIILVAAGFVLALAMGYFISRWLSASISRIVDNLSSQAENVEDISKNIAQASQSLAASTSQQAAALQETTSALEQSSAMIKKNADNAQESTQVSEHSLNAVGVGKQAADEMLNAMDVISQSNDAIMDQIIQSNQELTEIVKVISDIGNKTKVINEIVFQTKLLSFNASVEAARAGEHGKGFAVVAEEVGSLAQMSGNAAKEISDMLGASLSRVESIVNNTKSRVEALIADGKTKVDEGKLTAQKCGQALDEIVENVSKISAMITEISTASQEQSKGISEINKAMSELDNSAQQSNAGSQVASSAAESLQHQVNNLRGMVIDLNALLTGENDQTDQTDQQHLQAS